MKRVGLALAVCFVASSALAQGSNTRYPTGVSLPNFGPGATTTGAAGQLVTAAQTDAKGRIQTIQALNNVFNVYDTRLAGGAKCDGSTDDTAVFNAAKLAVRDRGGVIYVPSNPAGTACMVSSTIVFQNASGHRYDNVAIVGDGPTSKIKASTPLMGGGGTGPIYFEGASNYDLKNSGLMNITIEGYDGTTDGVGPLVSWAFTDGGFAINVWMDTNADEGLYWNNPGDSKNALVYGCHATNVGGFNKTASDYRAAYNVNAHNAVVALSYAYQVGYAIEHTGDGFQILGNHFDYSGYNAGANPGIMIYVESPGGASGQNGNGEIVGNTIGHAELAIAVGSGSTRGIVIAENSIYNSDQGVNAASANYPVLISNNLFNDTISGSQGAAITCSGAGGCIIQGNTIVGGTTPWSYGVKSSDSTCPMLVTRNIEWGYIATGGAFYSSSASNPVEFIDNVVMDPASAIPTNRAIYSWNGTSINVLSWGSGIYRNARLSAKEPSVLFMSAAPTSGTWKVGDRVVNTAPSASGALQWICTTAGTPGTWMQLTLN